ncbi:Ferric/cupric reductase transmembrane component [Lachnellula suecica]|uniref:ferric-chelate reductase (NADPH) n=1 Tax=Lachnellula suecica TaxID=602035 RepID=A0A8T9C458_9HELO|nr:Ferric/cupric reductase transmembrane component [Lachnellula suecica]
MPFNPEAPASPPSPPHGMNATAIAAAAAAKKVMQGRALQQKNNENVAKYFAAAMAGVIIMFTIFHWSRFLYSRYATKGLKESKIMRAQVSAARLTRHFLNRRVPGFTSWGHAVLVVIYLAINVILTVTNVVDWGVSPVAKRLGWLAMCNIAFITFLALKNTPLAYLTAYSYESLNPLHQVAGYTTITQAFLHAILQCITFEEEKFAAMLLELEQINGITAVAAFFVLLVTALAVRKLRYELFYVIHITMFMLIIINLALHRPDFSKKTVIIIIVAAAMWGSDRIFRGSRVLWNSVNNRATIYSLPHGGTRIVLNRSPSRTIPGTHCFLWVPKIRLLETHPFTIVSATPTSLELVISAYDGFTNDLHNYALKNPGITLRASIDGPYGALPNFGKVADKVILISGGSGASFTFGVALDMIKKVPEASKLSIDFIWTVREPETLSWFRSELNELKASPRVNLFLYTTRPSPSNESEADAPSTLVPSINEEKKHASSAHSSSTKADPNTFGIDIEKKSSSVDSSTSLEPALGRPDVDAMIRDVVSKSGRNERIMIAACGPDQLMWTVRRTAASCISVSGASIELHCEQFGW